jgi:hypothetical protein
LKDASVEEMGVGDGDGGDVVVIAEGGDLEETEVIGSVLAILGVVVRLFGGSDLEWCVWVRRWDGVGQSRGEPHEQIHVRFESRRCEGDKYPSI